MPWRPGPGRIVVHHEVVQWWQRQGFNVIEGDSDHEVFNLSAARNDAVRKAEADVVIVADADTIPSIDAVRRAITEVNGNVIYPFNRYLYLTPAEHCDPDMVAMMPVDREYKDSVGGLFVVQPQTYWKVGGMDENFRQWGYEDRAFYYAASSLVGTASLPGTCYAFGHEADRDMSSQNPGWARIQLYRLARTDPRLMQELITRT